MGSDRQRRRQWLTGIRNEPLPERRRARAKAYFALVAARRDILAQKYPQLPASEIERIAYYHDPYAPCQSRVLVYPQLKRSGGHRPICSLPRALRLTHALIADVVRAAYPAGMPFYHVGGRSHHQAVADLSGAVSAGSAWVGLLDIASFHSSVDLRAVRSLDLLPSRVIRNALDTRALQFFGPGILKGGGRANILIREDDDTLPMNHGGQTAPQGLMQGSPASTAIATALIADVFSCAPAEPTLACMSLFVFGDNIAVAARYKSSCEDAIGRLAQLLLEHRAGPFTVTTELHHASEGFDWLGYAMRLVGLRVQIEPSHPNLERAMGRIDDWCALADFQAAQRAVGQMMASFPLSDPSLGRQIISELWGPPVIDQTN